MTRAIARASAVMRQRLNRSWRPELNPAIASAAAEMRSIINRMANGSRSIPAEIRAVYTSSTLLIAATNDVERGPGGFDCTICSVIGHSFACNCEFRWRNSLIASLLERSSCVITRLRAYSIKAIFSSVLPGSGTRPARRKAVLTALASCMRYQNPSRALDRWNSVVVPLLAIRSDGEGRRHAAVRPPSHPATVELQWCAPPAHLESLCEHAPCCSR